MSEAAGSNGHEHHKVTVVTVLFDHETCLVSLGIKGVAVGLAQMMIDEAVRQLEFIRRSAVVQEMQQRAADAQRTQAILDRLGR
jgi:hypothetical protein